MTEEDLYWMLRWWFIALGSGFILGALWMFIPLVIL